MLAASVCAIVGLFADRVVFVSAGQIVPTTSASGVVSSPFAEYVPSFAELSIVIGAFAFVALLYTLAERYLDLTPHEGHFAAERAVTAWVPAPTEGVL